MHGQQNIKIIGSSDHNQDHNFLLHRVIFKHALLLLLLLLLLLCSTLFSLRIRNLSTNFTFLCVKIYGIILHHPTVRTYVCP
jgi:hypothetical protein